MMVRLVLLAAATVLAGCSLVEPFDDYAPGVRHDGAAFEEQTDVSEETDAAEDTDPITDSEPPVDSTKPVDSTPPVDTGTDACPSGTTRCGDTCADTENDARRCGASCVDCVAAKGPLAKCISGACACPSGTNDCGGTCTRVESDPDNCGSCGRKVDDGSQWCVNKAIVCRPGLNTCVVWNTSWTSCPTKCLDTSGEGNHCYTYGATSTHYERCYYGSSSIVGRCINRDCKSESEASSCPAGRRECPVTYKLAASYVRSCVDDKRDPNHCGACDNKCNGSQVCAQGSCRGYRVVASSSECPAGWKYCEVPSWTANTKVCVEGSLCPI